MNSYEGVPNKRQRMNDNGINLKGEYESSESSEPPHKFSHGPPPQPNKVLLFTIINAIYPITTKVMESICKDIGEVQRIVIFRKRGVQAMVEFDSIQSAQHAKASLNGADIYSGCCTLKIEYAKPARLNVYKNDNETWDYTGALDNPEPGMGQQQALLGDAPAGYGRGGYGGGMGSGMVHAPPMRGMAPRPRHPMSPMGGLGSRGRGGMMPGVRPQRHGIMGAPPPQQQMPDYNDYGGEDYGQGISQSPVVMVYGLKPEKMNGEKLFNLLCLYGNVLKVKFLKSKPGTAMVQMGDPASVDRAIQNLSGIRFFGEKLTLGPSKQMFLTDSGQIGELDDKTPSFVDFSNSRNNRFTTTEQAAKNRIQKPAPVLHYFNAPTDMDEEKTKQLCEELSVAPPTRFTQFKTRSERSSSGLLEFSDRSEAMECLAVLNHYKLENPGGRYPYILKLCFSTSSSSQNYGPNYQRE
ncbi:heterogeneous nuclear ribonucleoprotein L-like [Styela clava]|uniref:heterogeneous nuclear ribonucleoprotein L-like n=1 Tax=Styela clava TaxID=7725 RepID=UPI0019393492|nr:heterogeneous nuclear ribonucleoprotein L-like [Styela clava]XP_039260084.1 heterogeneous nuclear ribonucleoprotein L-like [Styela clava]